MASKTLLIVLGVLMATALLFTAKVASEVVDTKHHDAGVVSKKDVGPPAYGGGGYGGCTYGCCGRGEYGGCRCCSTATEIPEAAYLPPPTYGPGGGGGGYGGCTHGCCGSGEYGGCRCCSTATEIPEAAYLPDPIPIIVP